MFTKGFVLIQSIGEYSDRTETTLAFSENENELKEKQIQLKNETEQRLLHFEKSENDIKSYLDKYYREIDDQWDYNKRKIWFVENPVPEEIDDFIWISDSENDLDLKNNSEKFIELQQIWASDLYVSYHIQSFGNDSSEPDLPESSSPIKLAAQHYKYIAHFGVFGKLKLIETDEQLLKELSQLTEHGINYTAIYESCNSKIEQNPKFIEICKNIEKEKEEL